MGMLPVPEEVRDMHEKINRIVTMVVDQNHLLQRISTQMDQLKLNDKEIAAIRAELSEIRNALTIIKDCVRLERVA